MKPINCIKTHKWEDNYKILLSNMEAATGPKATR